MDKDKGLEKAREIFRAAIHQRQVERAARGEIPTAQVGMMTDIVMAGYDVEIDKAMNE